MAKLSILESSTSNAHVGRYCRFIEGRERRTLEDGVYVERHHILPKSLGGDNSEDNLIFLTAREHFIAHLILWKAFSGSMATAFLLMSNGSVKHKGNRYFSLSSRQYKVLREDSRKSNEGRVLLEKDGVLKKPKKEEIDNYLADGWTIGGLSKVRDQSGESNPFYGQHHSKSTRSKLAEAHTGREHSKDSKIKMRESWTYESHFTDDAKKKMSEAQISRWESMSEEDRIEYCSMKSESSPKGEEHHFFGKHHKKDSKRKTSESLRETHHLRKKELYKDQEMYILSVIQGSHADRKVVEILNDATDIYWSYRKIGSFLDYAVKEGLIEGYTTTLINGKKKTIACRLLECKEVENG